MFAKCLLSLAVLLSVKDSTFRFQVDGALESGTSEEHAEEGEDLPRSGGEAKSAAANGGGGKGFRDGELPPSTPRGRSCPADGGAPCVPKCCAPHEVFADRAGCTASTEDSFLLDFADLPNRADAFRDIPVERRYRYFVGNPCRNGRYRLEPDRYPDDVYAIFSNGTLRVQDGFLTMDEFCIESSNGSLAILVCFPEERPSGFRFALYPAGLLISIPFLVLTAVVYVGFERLRDVQGMALACHVTCLAVAYFFLSLVQLATHELNGDVCTAAAFLIQFSFVACFLWLNVLCFDTWRNIPASRRESTGSSEKTKFIYYSLYAWNVACVLSVVSLVMDLGPAIPESYLKPKFGIQSCWFQSDTAALSYFYGPVGVLILINVVFFILSARMIYSERKSYAELRRKTRHVGDSEVTTLGKIRVNVAALKRCFSLFCVMGINWAAEVVSWLVGGSDFIWLVTDIFNTLQGLIIFYLFVIKPKSVREEVAKKAALLFAPCACFDRRARGESEPPEGSSPRLLDPRVCDGSSAFVCPKDTDIRYIDASATSLTDL